MAENSVVIKTLIAAAQNVKKETIIVGYAFLEDESEEERAALQRRLEKTFGTDHLLYLAGDHEMYKNLYNSLLNTQCTDRADTYFILKDFRSYAEAHEKIDKAYRDRQWWAKAALINVSHSGKFTSDRTIEEYVKDIWHLEKVKVEIEANQ